MGNITSPFILIAGAGSIGTVLGMELADRHSGVKLLRRSPPYGKLEIEMVGVREKTQTVDVVNLDMVSDTADIVFITVQEQHTLAVCQDLREAQILSDKTILVSLQNGITASTIICDYFPDQPVIQGTVWWSATLYGPTKVLYHRKADMDLGIPSCSVARTDDLDIIKMIIDPYFNIGTNIAIEKEARKKLILNVVSPVLAMVKLPYPEGLQHEYVRQLVHLMFDDALHIANTMGWETTDHRLDNFHQLLAGEKEISAGVRYKLPHKVSTQIGIEKYGGSGSNVGELFDLYIEQGSNLAAEIKRIIEDLPTDYKPVDHEQLGEIIRRYKADISCKYNK